MRIPHALAVLTVAAGLSASTDARVAADRVVAWVAADGAFERDLNHEAARGLRLAAISDGLPCSVAALPAPDGPTSATTYRVVPDRELAALSGLVAEGFVPRAATRIAGIRHAVAFERTTPMRPPLEWRLLYFETLEALSVAMFQAAVDGFRAKGLVRPPFRSWPGLSEPGIVLAAKQEGGPKVESRVLLGTNRDLNDIAAPLKATTADGWTLDLLFSSARDDSRDLRRERIAIALSRQVGTTTGAAVSIARPTSFGLFGAGTVAGAAAFWHDYLTAWTPRDRRQIWASPIQLTGFEANCGGLELKLRLDGRDGQAHDIVALLAKPRPTDAYELVVGF